MNSMVPSMPKARLLIVEDEIPLLAYLRQLLSTEYEVYTAESSAEAEEIVRHQDVEIILCDHDMPGEKGLDFLSRVRWQRPKTQRILLTAHAEKDVFLQAINEGDVLKFLVKPASLEDIREAVAYAVREYERVVDVERTERERYALANKLHSVPFMTRRIGSATQRIWDLFGTTLTATMISAGIVLLLGTIVVLVLYFLKSSIGIEL